MGNPFTNWLPQCQLTRIQNLVNDLDFKGRNRDETLGFWMDTICIPVHDKHKAHRKHSIRNMRLIYAKASAVLVLDSWMQEVSATAIPPDRLAHFHMSGWLRRLWTLQEGILNRNLFLRFDDGTQIYDSLNDQYLEWQEHAQAKEGRYLAVRSSFGLHTMVMQDIVQDIVDGKDQASQRSMFYYPIADLLCPRATTRASDETLCLSTILGLDPKPYLDIENKADDEDVVQRRMKAFLEEIHKFSPKFIFNTYRKLTIDGVRWAPRSLLGYRSYHLGPTLDNSWSQDAELCEIATFSGILVSFPGFIVEGLQAGSTSFSVTTKKERDYAYYVVELVPVEGNKKLQLSAGVPYTVLLSDKLTDESQHCYGAIGTVAKFPDDEKMGEEIRPVRYEFAASVERRLGKAPLACKVVKMMKAKSQWLVM